MVENFDLTVATSNHSWSKSITETVVGSHNITFTGYSLVKGVGPGRYVSGEIFNVGGYDWVVYFYPDGRYPEDLATYNSVFIALATQGIGVRALFEIKLMDQSGNGNHKVFGHFNERRSHILKSRGSMWGFRQFYKRVSFESSDYLKNDSCEMHCKIGVIRSRVEGPRRYYIPIPPSNMGNDIKFLLDSGLGANITFLVGDEKFKAHKLVLSTRSSVFKAQFFENPNLNEVEIAGIKPTVFKLMLQYIYSSEFTYSTLDPTLMTKTMHHLLTAANRYGLDRLRSLCEAKLGEGISIDNVATTLCLAEQNRCLQLKALCIKFTVDNLSGV